MTLDIVTYYLSFLSFLTYFFRHIRTSFSVFCGGEKVTSLLKFRVLISCLTLHASCLSPWARQNFPVFEYTLEYNHDTSQLCKTGHDDMSRTRMTTLAFILSELFPLDFFRCNFMFAP